MAAIATDRQHFWNISYLKYFPSDTDFSNDNSYTSQFALSKMNHWKFNESISKLYHLELLNDESEGNELTDEEVKSWNVCRCHSKQEITFTEAPLYGGPLS